MICAVCNWPLDDTHVFNVRCSVANAEAEACEAEVRAVVSTDELDPKIREAMLDTLALMRVFRDSRRWSGTPSGFGPPV